VQYRECVKLRTATQLVKPSQRPTLQQGGAKAVAHHIAKDMAPVSTVEQRLYTATKSVWPEMPVTSSNLLCQKCPMNI